LREQEEKVNKLDETVKNMLLIKEIGFRVLKAFESGSLGEFGELMHEHWMAKKNISEKMTSPRIDFLYELARENGAIGGKIMGAGGGGFFMFYCENINKCGLRKVLKSHGLRELKYHFDFDGTKVLANF
jgi:D-glycero-alpha-D-manno-heptose-7-phosphate kinase